MYRDCPGRCLYEDNETGALFIADTFRTFRKYFASAIAISQNMDDFAKSRVSGALLSNAATKWILNQGGADQKRLREVLGLNEQEASLVRSLKQIKGKYSEVFLMADTDRAVMRVEPTESEYKLSTTDPREIEEVDQ